MATPGFAPVIGTPRYAMAPELGAIRPAMHRSRVLFPLPDFPSRATISPSFSVKEMSSSTGRGLPSGEVKAFETWDTSRIELLLTWGFDTMGSRPYSEREVGLCHPVETAPEQTVYQDHEQAHDDHSDQHLGEVVR